MAAKENARALTRGALLLGAVLAAAAAVSLAFGAVRFSPAELLGALSGDGSEAAFVVRHLRLPRMAVSALVGAFLAAAGAVFQALLRNPLADPFVLGISGGAAAGAVVAISVGAASVLSPPLAAFLGALLAMAGVYAAASRNGTVRSETLLLVGVIANAFFSAVILFVLALANPGTLARSYQWMMGHLAGAGQTEISYLVPAGLAATALVVWQAGRIHLLQLGSETAWHLGIDVRNVERTMYVAACLFTAVAVAAAGMVGFVGLITPHIVRRLFGHDFRVLFPLSMMGGAVLLVLSDTLARTLLAPSELPVGVLTALLGAPFFFAILRRRLA
jgi:iron complex transport system permease protein